MISLLVYCGCLAIPFGASVALVPVGRPRLRRRIGGIVLLAGAISLGLGLVFAPGREVAPPNPLLDRFLPEYDVNEFSSIRIEAPPDRIEAAIRSVRARDVRFLPGLFWLRGLPARLGGAHGPSVPMEAPLLPRPGAPGGYILLTHGRQGFVIGMVGRFWEIRGVPVVPLASPEAFLATPRPGLAKAAMSFRIEPLRSGGCRLATETRVHCGDERGRRSFLLYWRFVHPGSALLRLSWLQAIKRLAES